MKIQIPEGKYCKTFKKSQGCYFLEVSEHYDEDCSLHHEYLGQNRFGILKCSDCINKEPIQIEYEVE